LPADGLLLVVELVDVAAPLVGDLKDGPLGLVLADIVRRGVLRILHLVAEDQQVVLDVAEPLRRGLALGRVADGRHILLLAELVVEVE